MGSLHPMTALLTLLLAGLALGFPRRLALAPILFAAVVLPDDQRIVIAGLDWTMFRLLILVSLARLVMRNEAKRLHMGPLDYVMIAFCVVTAVSTIFLYGSISAFVNRLGQAFDVLGFYFLCRFALRSARDLQTAVFVALVSMLPLAASMTVEWATGRNLFALLGGVPEYTVVREGRLRCQGAFSHPIMTGLFAASWVPLFAIWLRPRIQPRFVMGFVAALMVVVFTASSTPVLALAAGLGALSLWRFRDWVPIMRWGFFASLVVIHFVREKPVWHLLARVNVVGGSTGWHRYYLIDETINHFTEWALFGTKSTAHWGMGLFDVTNEFIWAGVRGGLAAMLLLLAAVVIAFSSTGRAAKTRQLPPEMRWMSWCLGSTLMVHLVSFFSVAYFGQMSYVWYMHLAMAATVGSFAKRARLQHGRAAKKTAKSAAKKAARKKPATASPKDPGAEPGDSGDRSSSRDRPAADGRLGSLLGR